MTHVGDAWASSRLCTHGLSQAICVGAVVMNLTLMAFNLLVPAYPLVGAHCRGPKLHP